MEHIFNIKLNYKNNYSYGIYHAGFDLFDSIQLENRSDLAYSAVKVQVASAPNILLKAEKTVDYIAPGSSVFLSGDFIQTDVSLLAAAKNVMDVCVTVFVFSEEGTLLQSRDFSLKILPYHYFSGLADMPETAAFFVTPSQPELAKLDAIKFSSDSIDFCHQIYDHIKDLRIRLSAFDYSDSVPIPVRLCEKVIKDLFANSFELALLYASACERGGISPIIAFVGKNKVYVGFSLRKTELPLFTVFDKSNKNLEDLYFIDGTSFALGSELSFDSAIFQAKNTLNLSDERILILNVSAARKRNLLPLPNRYFDQFDYVLSEKNEETKKHTFAQFDEIWKNYSEDDRIKSILLGNRLFVSGEKKSVPFQTDLDVNQNKILGKIFSNDFSLIRAGTGTGVSKLFARGASMLLEEGKNVLYIADPSYHPHRFEEECKSLFDPSFIWNLMREENRVDKPQALQIRFDSDPDYSNENRNALSILEQIDSYYSALDGDKRIVSSFLMASDRFDQLKDANDSVIISPEQVGMLSDEMVKSWFSAVNEVVKSFAENGNIHENPLQFVRQKKFSYEYKSKLISQLEEVLHSTASISIFKEQLLPFFPSLGEINSFGALKSFCELVRLFSDFRAVPSAFFDLPEQIESRFREVTSLLQAKEENDTIYETVSVSFQDSVFDLDATELFSRFEALSADKGIKAMSQKHSILKNVKRYIKPNCDVPNIEYTLKRLDTFQKNKNLIENEKTALFPLFSVLNEGTQNSWKELQGVADLCYQCYFVFQGNFASKKLPDFVDDFVRATSYGGVIEKAKELLFELEKFTELKTELEQLVLNEIDFFYPRLALREEDYFVALNEVLSGVLAEVDHLKNWCRWLSVRDETISLGLKNIILAVENGKVSHEELKRSFLRAFFKAVCEYNYIVHPELIPDRFSVGAKGKEYREASLHLEAKKKANLDSKLSSVRAETAEKNDSENVLPSELFFRDLNRFSALYPCVISDMKRAKDKFDRVRGAFDVIFIESRSSISLEDVLWTFYAGKQVVFAGSFSFSSKASEKEFDLSLPAFDYLWKITDEKYSLSATYFSDPILSQIKASFLSQIRSDFRFYTIPSPRKKPLLQSLVVPGIYGGEYPNANFYEATRVVEELVLFAMNEKERSIGVVAATEEQKKLILRLFAQKLRHQEELASCFSDYSRFYITSLGEALYPCDKLIFSATFAPDKSMPGARLPYSFLEFGGEDPIKAIFHMLSSAKEEILLVSSFKKEDLAFTRSVLPAVTAYRCLFDCIDISSINSTCKVHSSYEDSSVIKRLRTALQERGYSAVSGIQSGRYYIDLAVLDEKGDFALGILSDFSVLNQKANIAAIEIANSDFYEKWGWKIYRLRAPFALDSFESELQNILQLLQNDESTSEMI